MKIHLNFVFITVYSETFPNGQSVNVAAPVGLLTRNIKIIGEDYENLYRQSYGARVLVGLYATAFQTYTGTYFTFCFKYALQGFEK